MISPPTSVQIVGHVLKKIMPDSAARKIRMYITGARVDGIVTV
jgi:hypothetical protein